VVPLLRGKKERKRELATERGGKTATLCRGEPHKDGGKPSRESCKKKLLSEERRELLYISKLRLLKLVINIVAFWIWPNCHKILKIKKITLV
jgi:hypothetical protein